MLEAARRRGQAVDHLLFAGPPGLGKTTLAGIVAAEMGVHLHITSGPALERAGDLAAILTKLEEGDVLFIDEIHRLSRAVEEILYPAMEDFQLDIVVGKGPAASSIRLTLPPFTLVGATTRTGHDHRAAARPLRARRPARLLRRRRAGGDRRAGRRHPRRRRSTTTGAWEIARRSRGTPRIANRLLRRVRDFAEVRGDGTIDAATARDGPAACSASTTAASTRSTGPILGALCQQFGGGPVGLSTLAISVGEQPETVEDVYEPFLIQQGLIARTPRGRVAMPAAYEHLGLTSPPPAATRRPACSTDAARHPSASSESSASEPRQLRTLGSELAGWCSARKAIVLAQAALAAASFVEHLRLVVVEGVAGGLDVEHEPVPAGDRRGRAPRRPRSGCRRRSAPKWNSVGQRDVVERGRACRARRSRSS